MLIDNQQTYGVTFNQPTQGLHIGAIHAFPEMVDFAKSLKDLQKVLQGQIYTVQSSLSSRWNLGGKYMGSSWSAGSPGCEGAGSRGY